MTELSGAKRGREIVTPHQHSNQKTSFWHSCDSTVLIISWSLLQSKNNRVIRSRRSWNCDSSGQFLGSTTLFLKSAASAHQASRHQLQDWRQVLEFIRARSCLVVCFSSIQKKHTPSLFTSPFFDIYLWTKNRKWEWKEWKSNRASASATAVSTREKRPSWPVTHSAAIANGKDKPYGTYEYTTQLSTDTIINLNHSNHIDLFREILTLKFIINSHFVSS